MIAGLNPAISVLIPSYQHARYIRKCIESVLAQTYGEFEIIVVDDGSADDSLDIIRSITDSRIRLLINEHNLGTYGTLDRALELSNSPLVAVLNSDDLWSPTKLESQIALLDKCPDSPLCYTLGTLIDDDDNPLPSDHHHDYPRTEVQELFPYLLANNRVFASSVVFRREQAYFDPALAVSGDWLALLKPSWRSQVLCIPERLASWRIHGESTHRRRLNVAKEHIGFRGYLLHNADRWLNSRFDNLLVRSKLGECAMHVCADEVLFGRMNRARSAAALAYKFGFGRTAIKRYLATFLPKAKVLRHLWPDAEGFFDSAIEPDAIDLRIG